MPGKYKEKYLSNINRYKARGLTKPIALSALVLCLLILLLLLIGFSLGDVSALLIVFGLLVSVLIPVIYTLHRRQKEVESLQDLKYRKALKKISSLSKKNKKLSGESARNKHFLKASKQLWDPNVSYRLAGVSAIVSLADDWAKAGNIAQRDACIDLLCSYLRGKPKYVDPIIPLIESENGVNSSELSAGLELNDEQIRDEICKQIANHLGKNVPNTLTSWSNHKFDFSHCTFNNLDLTGAIFKDKTDFSHTFFVGKVVFKDTIFKKVVSFTKANFGNYTSFINTNFKDNSNFIGARFGDKSLFIETLFAGEANFNGANFGDQTDFINSNFIKTANFNTSIFGDETNFIGAKFHSNTFFNGARFGENIFFTNALLNEKTFFIQTNFANNVDFSGTYKKDNKLEPTEIRALLQPCSSHPKEFTLIKDQEKTDSNSLASEVITIPW